MFNDFTGRLKWIATEWKSLSDDLAAWAMERLVNRRDVWGQYTLKPDGDIGVFTLPVKERRGTGTDMVTLNKLRRHFSGTAVSHLIGLHATSDHGTCKWFAVDVDLHDETIVNSDEQALANLAACLAWSKELRKHYMDPCLIDSNGVGGFHLLVLLDREYPVADVYGFAASLREGFEKYGLSKKPEIFPSKPETSVDKLGNWLRLPGRHHTRQHFSRIWNFDKEGEWLEGNDAIEALLALRATPLPQSAIKTLHVVRPVKSTPVFRRPRVCVDLDGVLARYDGWQGRIDQIGAPVPGALDFMHALSKMADIVVFTSRCSLDNGGEEPRRISPGKLKINIVDWLEKHKFPFTDVYIGHGKPRASAFIDDRAISCRPQTDPQAFAATLANIKTLLRHSNTGKLGGNMSENEFENSGEHNKLLRVSFGNKQIVQIAAGALSRVAGEIREFYLHERGDDYSLELIFEAMLRWIGSHIESLNDDMEVLFLEPHRKESLELRTMLKEMAQHSVSAEPAAAASFAAVAVTPESQLSDVNLFNGFRQYSPERFFAMINRITQKGEKIYKTKLNKLLFYSDFVNFYLHGKSISGAQYVHLPFGPVPDGYEATLQEMSTSKLIQIKKTKVPTGEAELIQTGKPGIFVEDAVLSAEELETIDWVLEHYGRLSAADISESSHREMAYRHTKPNEIIAYGYAQFFRKLPVRTHDK